MIGVGPDAGWLADSRLSLMSRQWSRIAEFGLSSYAEHAIQRALDTPGLLVEENYLAACVALLGCEEAGGSGTAASVMVRRGLELFGPQGLAEISIQMLRRVSSAQNVGPHAGARPGRSKQANPRLDLFRRDGRTFPQEFVDRLLPRVLDENSATEPMRRLVELGFWNSERTGVHSSLARYLDRQMNLQYGHTAHRHGVDANYVAFVEELISGSLLPQTPSSRCHELALYVIKHSVRLVGVGTSQSTMRSIRPCVSWREVSACRTETR